MRRRIFPSPDARIRRNVTVWQSLGDAPCNPEKRRPRDAGPRLPCLGDAQTAIGSLKASGSPSSAISLSGMQLQNTFLSP